MGDKLNYSLDIKRVIEYIEVNIKEKLTPEMLASDSGYSLYHFCRVFQVCMNMPVMEYIRKRRLSLAAVELFKGRRIIDIAFDYGFETQSGFTKAFRKEYGFSPTQYTARMAVIKGLLSGEQTTFEFGGIFMNPVVASNKWNSSAPKPKSQYSCQNFLKNLVKVSPDMAK